MSIVGTKWNSKSRTVNGEWETVVTVHETFEKRDGSTEIKTREIKMEGHPDKATMKAAVESSRQKPRPINPEDFVRESVREHNTLRQRHGVPPLNIAQDLCDVAQKWANYLIDNNKFEHNSSGFGENIAQKTGNPCTLDYAGWAATRSWYNEIKDYTFFGSEPLSKKELGGIKIGHFTQVIWKNTKEMGIAKAKKDGRVVVVANYRPAGNVIGSYAKNVFPPKG